MSNGGTGSPGVVVEDCDFIFLLRYTTKGLESLQQSPNRVAMTSDFVASKLKAFCGFISTSGKYDMISLFKGTDEQAYQFQLWLRSLGTLEVDMLKFQHKSMKSYGEMLRGLF